MNIADIRKDYTLHELSESNLLSDPIAQFQLWFQQAIDAQVNEPNAMTLATVNAAGMPSARIVLLKGIEQNSFVFFTNYKSQKGNELAQNKHAALVFFWPELQRQIRIEGTVEKISEEASVAYFKSRPFESQIGAVVSAQSSKIENREVLEKAYEKMKNECQEAAIQKPENWGGFSIKPTKIEFWQGRASRLHDRLCFVYENENWTLNRLAP
jgi:pyridoxamine 5'-phosphate oxidase